MAAKTSMTDMSMCGIKMISWKLGHIRQPFQVCARSCTEKISMSILQTMWREAMAVSRKVMLPISREYGRKR